MRVLSALATMMARFAPSFSHQFTPIQTTSSGFARKLGGVSGSSVRLVAWRKCEEDQLNWKDAIPYARICLPRLEVVYLPRNEETLDRFNAYFLPRPTLTCANRKLTIRAANESMI